MIVLTEELLATAKQSEISLPAFGTNADASPIQHQSGGSSEHLMVNLFLKYPLSMLNVPLLLPL